MAERDRARSAYEAYLLKLEFASVQRQAAKQAAVAAKAAADAKPAVSTSP